MSDTANRKQQVILIANQMESDLNTFYDTMAKMLFNCDTHRFHIKGESVIETGFWVVKKGYAMRKVYDLETNKDMEKMVVKGLSVVRSSFPAAFKTIMSEILNDILTKVPKEQIDTTILNFYNNLSSLDYLQLARNTSVKNISDYEDVKEESLYKFASKTPAHVKSAIIYNRLLRRLGVDKKYPKIGNGDKVKYIYLKKNPYGIDTLALKTYEDPPELVDFVQQYMDPVAMFEKELENKLADFYTALNWGLLPTAINQTANEFFSFSS